MKSGKVVLLNIIDSIVSKGRGHCQTLGAGNQMSKAVVRVAGAQTYPNPASTYTTMASQLNLGNQQHQA